MLKHQPELEIKTFSISPNGERNKLQFSEIGTRLFNLDEDLTSTLLIDELSTFIKTSFGNIVSQDGFYTNDKQTKKIKLESIESDIKNSCIHGIILGGNIGNEGHFNKKNVKKLYDKTKVGPEDFTDCPFLFQIYFPVKSDTGVILIQKFKEKSLNIELKALIKHFFDIKGFTLRYNPFISKQQKEKFEKGSFVDKITVIQNKASKNLGETFSFISDEKEYKIKIEISEIKTPVKEFLKSIVSSTENDIEKHLDFFEGLNAFGIDKENSKISATIKDGNIGKSNTKLKDMGNYLERLIPILQLSNCIEITEAGLYEFQKLKKEIDKVLNSEVIPTMKQN